MSDATTALRVFGKGDGNLSRLAERTIAFIGYGNPGRAPALNLRDSGVGGIGVGTLQDDSWSQAATDGFPVQSMAEAARAADILFLLIPDEELPKAFQRQIAPQLQPNDAIVLASGFLSFTTATMGNIVNLGLYSAAAIVLALLADVLLAPALLMLLPERLYRGFEEHRSPTAASQAPAQ